MDNLRRKTISAVNWNFLGRIFSVLVSLIVIVVLARLLSPESFGVMAMATVLARFARVLIDMGFGNALIQRTKVDEDDLSTVFWLNAGAGVLLALGFALASSQIAAFFGKEILEPIVLVLSTVFILQSVGVVHGAMLRRGLQFRRLFQIQFAASTGAAVVAMAFAIYGAGVWSLVAQEVAVALIGTALLWRTSDWSPKLRFCFESLRSLSRFGLPLVGTASLNYWVRNIDSLLIGKVLGDEALGLYNRAYSLMLLPVNNVAKSISPVMFPSLSSIKHDRERVKRIFLKATRAVALVTVPMMLGLVVVAEPFVRVMLGSQWTEIVPIVQLLALVGIIQSVGVMFQSLYLSQGATALQFKVGLVLRLHTIIWIVLGLQYGIRGVATGYLIAVCLNFIPNLYTVGRLVSLTIREYFFNLVPVLACAAAMFGFLLLLDHHLLQDRDVFTRLAGGVAAGTIVFWASVHGLRVRAYTEVSHEVREQLVRLIARRRKRA